MRAPLLRTRCANDAEIEDDKVKELVSWLKKKLSKEDFQTLKAMVGVGEEMGEDKKKPSVAADSRGNRYEDRFPDAARIRVWL